MRRPHKIELWSEAEDDFDNSHTYYAERSEKAADDFYQHVNDCLDRISQDPLTFPVLHRNIRKCTVPKFPFIIFSKVNEIIEVIAIFHTSRNLQTWKERI